MKISTGLIGVFLAVGAVAVSLAHSNAAQAHSGALRAVPGSAASAAPDALAPSSTPATPAAPERAPAAPEFVPAFGSLPPTLEPSRALRRMQARELTPAMMQVAAQIVRKYYAKPVGTNVDVLVEGTHFVARIERHYHPDGGPIKPWGFHPGVSLFSIR